MKIVSVDYLKEWGKNLRTGDEKGDQQTEDILELIGNKLEPLAMMPDGVLLDGNGRLPLYKKKGFTQVPVIEVDVRQDVNGLWTVWIEEEETKAKFGKKEDGMQYVAMARNHKPRHLDSQKLKDHADEFGIDWSQFSGALEPEQSVDEILKTVKPIVGPVDPVAFNYVIQVVCESQEQQESLYSQLHTEGYNVRIKTTPRKAK